MNTFEIITALTVASIGAIILLYFIVLKKKGWLRDETSSQTGFLCPNSQCRKVFKEPVWLTDLSHTPPESYQACPHCGFNIQLAPSSSTAQHTPEFSSQPKPPLFINKSQKQSDKLHYPGETPPRNMETESEIHRHAFTANIPKNQEESLNRQTSKPIIQNPKLRREAPKPSQLQAHQKQEERRPSDSPRSCIHFFGYVRTLPKNTPIPDECLWCPSIVECLASQKKIEA